MQFQPQPPAQPPLPSWKDSDDCPVPDAMGPMDSDSSGAATAAVSRLKFAGAAPQPTAQTGDVEAPNGNGTTSAVVCEFDAHVLEDIRSLLLKLGDLFRVCMHGNLGPHRSGDSPAPPSSAPASAAPCYEVAPTWQVASEQGLSALTAELKAMKGGLEDTMEQHRQCITSHQRLLELSLQYVPLDTLPSVQFKGSTRRTSPEGPRELVEIVEVPETAGEASAATTRCEVLNTSSRTEDATPVIEYLSTVDQSPEWGGAASSTIAIRHLHTLAGRLENLDKRCIPNSLRRSPRSKLTMLVSGDAFALLCSIWIVLNTIFIGFSTEWSIRNVVREDPRQEPIFFSIVERFFLVAFTAELFLRIIGLRCSFVLGADWKWNIFDFLCVTSAVLEEFASMFNMSFLRVVRVVRMARVVRIIRVFRFFRELRLMVCSIFASMMSLTWAFFLLALIMYVFAILFTQAVADHIQHQEVPPDENMVRWYGSLLDTCYTLLLAISGGWSWHELAQPLTKISGMYLLLFIAYTLFVVFGMMNVLTGVFVDRASEISQLDRDLIVQAEQLRVDQFYKDMKDLFSEADNEMTGMISWASFKQFMGKEDVQTYFATIGVDVSEAKELFQLLDMDQGGSVSIEEFAFGLMRVKGQAKNLDVLRLQNRMQSVHTNVEDMLRLVRRMHMQMGASKSLPLSANQSTIKQSPSTRKAANGVARDERLQM